LVGALALTGIPPLSGFFSKDSILASALAAGTYGQILFVAGLVGAFLTGLYTFRMVFMVFGGEPSPYAREHFHRPERSEPWVWMGSTVAVLSVLAVVGGWVQIAGIWHPFADFLKPTVEPLVDPSGAQDLLASVLAVGLGLAGVSIAWAIYSAGTMTAPAARPVRALFEHKFYFDELYDRLFYRPGDRLARALGDYLERPLILGSVNGIAVGARRIAAEVGQFQTGLVRTYALAVAGGVAVLSLVFVWVK